jgi:cell division transport system permease protein
MVSVTFFVSYVFSFFVAGADQVLSYFETQPQIIAFFELETPASSITALTEKMESQWFVDSVKVVDQEEALRIYQEDNKNDPLLLELVTADILPASIEVAATDLNSLVLVKDELEAAPDIEDVVYQEDIVQTLSSWTQSVRLIGIAAIITLATISFLIIMTLIAMKAAHKRGTIKIMRFIGATAWYIKFPFIIEGMIYGLIGSLIGFGSTMASLMYASPWVTEFLGDVSIFPIPTEFLVAQISIGTIAGMLLGGFAGLVAVQRLIKQ